VNNTKPTSFDPEMVRALGRLDWIAQAVLEGFRQGQHRSAAKGFSSEFSEHRPYTPGNDLRFLDWRVYARTDKLYVKSFQAETSLECLLVLDASRSMAWRWEDRTTKLEYAVVMFAILTCMLTSQDDLVGLAVHDAANMHFVPRSGRRTQFERILSVLGQVRPSGAQTFPALIRSLTGVRRHKGQIIVCSDLEDERTGIEETLPLLAAGKDEVLLLHLLDRSEIDLPFAEDTTHQPRRTGAGSFRPARRRRSEDGRHGEGD